MKRAFQRFFVPHATNNHAPYLFRGIGIAVVLGLIGVFAGLMAFSQFMLRGSNFLAAVLPSVLTDLVNADRSAVHVQKLTVSPLLTEAARLKAEDMAKNAYFAHTSPAGVTPWFWIRNVGYRFGAAGENLAVHYNDSEAVNAALMASPSHRANILNNTFTEVGIATARGFFEGKDTVFVVQMFGRPIGVKTNASSSVSQAGQARAVASALAKSPKSQSVSRGVSGGQGLQTATSSLLLRDGATSTLASTLGVSVIEPEGALQQQTVPAWQRAVTSPLRLFTIVLGIFSLVVGVSLSLSVRRGDGRHRLAHITAGFVLLCVLSGTVVIARMFLVRSIQLTNTAAVIDTSLDFE
jgi:hypothetical protein